jgi:hypothetical protein
VDFSFVDEFHGYGFFGRWREWRAIRATECREKVDSGQSALARHSGASQNSAFRRRIEEQLLDSSFRWNDGIANEKPRRSGALAKP